MWKLHSTFIIGKIWQKGNVRHGKYMKNIVTFFVLLGGGKYFWWLVIGLFFVGYLVICTWKNWWFGDLQKLWWWWFTYFLLGDLVISSWKKWWFGDFEKLWWWWLSYFCRWFGDYSRSELRAKKVPKIAIF